MSPPTPDREYAVTLRTGKGAAKTGWRDQAKSVDRPSGLIRTEQADHGEQMQDVETGRVKAVYGYEGLEARVGDDAVAIADCERFARAAAGDRGVAIARGTASGAEAGQGAIVIAADHAAAGDSSIAIARSGEARA